MGVAMGSKQSPAVRPPPSKLEENARAHAPAASKQAEDAAKQYPLMDIAEMARPTGADDQPLAIELSWWRRDVAIAWILTGDQNFVQDQHNRPESEIVLELAYNEAHAPDSRKLTVIGAWQLLRRKVVDGLIQTKGDPFEQIDRGAGNVETRTESTRDIRGVEFDSLVLEIIDGQEKWVHDDWKVSRGSNWNNRRGYQNFRLRRFDVMSGSHGDIPTGIDALVQESASAAIETSVGAQTETDSAQPGFSERTRHTTPPPRESEESTDVRKPPRRIPSERPLGQDGSGTIVTMAWDLMTSNEKWATEGIPGDWSFGRITEQVNKMLGAAAKRNSAILENLRGNGISPDSVKRALGIRKS
jgi:hypothetical protein